jgi:uncharacterized protein YecT (DUF1311 family)
MISVLLLTAAFATQVPSNSESAGFQHDRSQRKDENGVSLRPVYDKCLDASGGVTSAILDCIKQEYQYQDKRLNEAYKKVMAVISEHDRQKFRDEERKWISYRDSHCALDSDSGQVGEIDSDDCLVEETAKQAVYLEQRAEYESMKH